MEQNEQLNFIDELVRTYVEEAKERGNELYQDTMVKLLEKQKKLDAAQNIKSYAMQTAILLWKARKIRRRNRHF
jgi:DNA-directed RNA polymerase specialized sigma24 family protein